MLRAARVGLLPRDIEGLSAHETALVLRGFEERERNTWRRTAWMVSTTHWANGNKVSPAQLLGEADDVSNIAENDVGAIFAAADAAREQAEQRAELEARGWTDDMESTSVLEVPDTAEVQP